MSSRFSSRSALVVCGLTWLGCASVQTGATVADLSRAQGPAAPGATVFNNECAKCHGQRGEGLGTASAILGPGALPEFPRTTGGAGDPNVVDPQLIQIQAQSRPAGAAWRDPFRNAMDLYNFTTKHLPKSQAESSEGRRLLGGGELHARRAGRDPAAAGHRRQQRDLHPDSPAVNRPVVSGAAQRSSTVTSAARGFEPSGART